MATTSVPTYYELLGVESGASPDEIKTAYKKAAKFAHPDAGGSEGLFRQLQIAYETLSDASRRTQYDWELSRQEVPNSPGGTAYPPPQSEPDPGASSPADGGRYVVEDVVVDDPAARATVSEQGQAVVRMPRRPLGGLELRMLALIWGGMVGSGVLVRGLLPQGGSVVVRGAQPGAHLLAAAAPVITTTTSSGGFSFTTLFAALVCGLAGATIGVIYTTRRLQYRPAAVQLGTMAVVWLALASNIGDIIVVAWAFWRISRAVFGLRRRGPLGGTLLKH